MRQGGSSFNDRCVPGGISEVQLREAKASFDICPTPASTLDETDSLQTLLRLASQPAGRLSPIVITLGRALCGRVRGFLGGLAGLKTLGEVGHVDAGCEQPDAFFRELPKKIG